LGLGHQDTILNEPAHILVVDDDPDVGFLLSEFFSGEGFRISVAESAKRTREALAENDVDLILLDRSLPDEDGFALGRDIMATSKAPVIFVTGRDDATEQKEAMALGAADYVVKPFALQDILAIVQAALRRAREAEG
jgi:two-component system OmpR family response regulator